MKKHYLLFILVASANLSHAQTIRRVNNSPDLNDPNVYATAQAAHDAAVAGDIISLEPAGTVGGVNYGNITMSKRLTIYGPGYYSDKNPNTIFDKRQVTLNEISFEKGSANSVIRGAEVGNILLNDINITVDRCKIGSVIFGSSQPDPVDATVTRGNNCTLTRCFISSEARVTGQQQLNGVGTLMSNNILNNPPTGFHSSVIIRNTINLSFYFRSLYNCTITNNIMVGYVSTDPNFNLFPSDHNSGNSISNNIYIGTSGLPSGGGNVNGADPAIMFVVGNPYGNINATVDADFKLGPNSPAKTVATDGGEAGAFGGGNPYILSGIPPKPVVTSYINSGSGNSSTPLSVTISVRSSN